MATLNVRHIAAGDWGSFQTVGHMRRLVNTSLTDPLVIGTARSIVLTCLPRDVVCRARAIRGWMLEHFAFVNDPRGVELVSTPRFMLDQVGARGVAQGDCDDAAVLGAALGKAVGLRARFVVVGFHSTRGRLSHVFTMLRAGPGWIELDVTRPSRGSHPAVSRVHEVEV